MRALSDHLQLLGLWITANEVLNKLKVTLCYEIPACTRGLNWDNWKFEELRPSFDQPIYWIFLQIHILDHAHTKITRLFEQAR